MACHRLKISVRGLMPFAVVFLTLLVIAVALGHGSFSDSTPKSEAQAKHGLTGSYYVSTLETHSDVNPTGKDWFVQAWFDPNDFQLPRAFSAPAAVRVDPQIAFGKGKGFVPQNGQQSVWWPTSFPNPAGWVQGSDAKPWEHLAAVIWKGYIRLPKAGTYYFATISNKASGVYLNQARVALNAGYGVVVSDAFSYAKEDMEDFAKNLGLAPSMEGWAPRASPEASYVVPLTIDAPRDLPIEVRLNAQSLGIALAFAHSYGAVGIDLFWVTPDSPRDASGKPVAQIVPSDVLYTEPPGPIEKPTVRGANSMLSANFLYFPADRIDIDGKVTIRLADKDGNPVAGKRVHVGSLVSYGGADAIKQPEKPTDEKGEATAIIRPGEGYLVTHDSTIFATDATDLVDVAQVAHVTFQAERPSQGPSFFPDGFSPYYDPDLIKVEPLPLRVGRPVTVSVALENRGKDAAELTASFQVNHLNIGAYSWTEIGKVEHIRLKPGEARRVSVNWTPGEAQTHQCFRVELSGRVLFASTQAGTGVVTAALLPTTSLVYAAPPDANSISQRIQTNLAGVESPPPCGAPTFERGSAIPTHTRPCVRSKAEKIYCDVERTRVREILRDPYKWVASSGLDIQERQFWLKIIYKGEDVERRLEDCMVDPPKPAYRHVAVAGSETPGDYLEAFTTSMERYQAAQLEGDREWMARHFTAQRLYLKRYADALRRDADDLQKTAGTLPPDDPAALSKIQAAQDRFLAQWRRGERFTEDQLKSMKEAGISEEKAAAAINTLISNKEVPTAKSGRTLLLEIATLYRQMAQGADELAARPANPGEEGKAGQPLVQTYTVGNPHDKEETVELFIRPISTPPDWKLSVVNAENAGASGQAAKPGDAPPKFPVIEREAAKHYAVRLPAKAQVQVISVVVPVGEVGANTTARWAVEGKIGNELIGGMVHEMNVPYVIADLKLPPVGSKEEEETPPAATRTPSAVIVAVAAGVLILVAFVFLMFRRRRPGSAA